MQQQDKAAFGEMMAEIVDLYGKDINPAPYWRILQRYDLRVVRFGVDAHMADPKAGSYIPKPADILRHIERAEQIQNPRIDEHEAWSLALASTDERATVVWTDEVAEAMGVANEVLVSGDKVGARMAFVSAYRRITERHRATGIKPSWIVSLGWDESGRVDAIESAVSHGLITQETAQHYLPEPEAKNNPVTALLTGNIVKHPSSSKAREREIARMREMLGAPDQSKKRALGQRQNERDMFEQKKAETIQKLSEKHEDNG